MNDDGVMWKSVVSALYDLSCMTFSAIVEEP